jgi:hypothetical protein
MMAVRYADCTRRQHRNREASELACAQTADASLSDFGTGDVSPSTGIHFNFTSNGNGNDPRPTGQPPSIRPAAYSGQASIHSLREHSGRTGVVGELKTYGYYNCNYNSNGRCAGNGNSFRK